MKKIISILLTLCLLMSTSMAFASPGKNNNKWKNLDIKEIRKQLKENYKDKGKRDNLIEMIISYYKNNYWDKYNRDDDHSLFVFANGEEIEIKNSSVIKHNKMIIPVNAITKGLGAGIKWDDKTHTATITKGNIKIVIDLNKKTITVNGEKLDTDLLKKQKNNAVVLIKLIGEILGFKVDVDDDVIIIDDGDVVSINDNVTGTGLNQFEYVGNWNYAKESGLYNGDNHWSSTADAYFQVRFSGTQIKLYGSKAPFAGIAAISIDGGPERKVDFYSSKRRDNVLLYSSGTLPNGQHTLKVRVTGTKNKKSTNYYVIADRVDVFGVTTPPTNDTQAPTVPQELTATAISESQIRLNWKASTDNYGVAGYKVFRNGTQIATVTKGTSYTDKGLSPMTPYVYTVTAYDYAGNSSEQSTPVVGITLSSTTTNIALNKSASSDSSLTGYSPSNAVDGNTSTRWSAADGGLNHWLMIDLGGYHSVTGTEVTWQFEKNYKYKVEVSADGTNWSLKVDKTEYKGTERTQKDTFTADSVRFVRITVTGLSINTWASISEFKVFGTPVINDTQAPTAPTDLTASAESYNKVKLTWKPSTDNVGVAGYKINRNGTQIAVVSNVTSFTDTGLDGETVYAYSVAAFDAAGNTSTYATAVVTTPAHVDSDIALKKTAYSDSSLTGYEASKANDGNTATSWYAKDGELFHWWKVDLGGLYNLKGTEITWPLKDKVYKYIVEVSSDNANWVVAVNKTGNTSSKQVQKDSFTADSVRYVRVTITGLEHGCWAGIAEFKALGSPKT